MEFCQKNMQDNLIKISFMAKEYWKYLASINMKDNLKLIKEVDWEYRRILQKNLYILDNLKKIRKMGMDK